MRFGTSDVSEAFEAFSYLGDGVQIFGSDAVKDAITEVLAGYVYISREATKRAGDKPVSPADFRAALEAQSERLNVARTALLEAMRGDVGP
jgi:hypothetical protein